MRRSLCSLALVVAAIAGLLLTQVSTAAPAKPAPKPAVKPAPAPKPKTAAKPKTPAQKAAIAKKAATAHHAAKSKVTNQARNRKAGQRYYGVMVMGKDWHMTPYTCPTTTPTPPAIICAIAASTRTTTITMRPAHAFTTA